MSNYTKTVNFATKDNLNSGNPLKIVKGTEIDTEYNNIATAVATKTDNAAAVIVGGTIDGTAIGGTTPAAGAFTTLAASSTTTLAGALVGAVTQAAFNTVSTTLNLGGAATAVNIGAATGTATVANTTLAAKAITASTTLNVTGASTLTGAVTATAGVTGPLTSSNATITGGTITGITDLAVADGGTGASTAANALNNLLPSQTGNANKYLQTDGTNPSWDAVSLSTADITGTLGVANGGTGVTSSTGTTNVVLSNSPTLVTPILGTPTSATLTNATGLPISTGVSGLGTGVATLLATPSSANLASAITDETGSGALVFATSPTLVTPVLGTPTSGTLTNATGLPISTGVSGLGTGVATFLATPSSANLRSALTDETGTGSAVFATSPTLVTPILGTPTSATLTNATGLPISTGVSGLGTGVATALAVNVGSSGAPLVNGGVLGTPSSGTATNLTGLPLSTGVTGTLPVANGGTGQTSYTDGQLLIGNTTGNTLTKATLTAGSNVTITNSAGGITIAAASGASPGGSTTQVQYNNAGAFAGITGATTNGTALTLVAPVLGTPASATLTNATGLPLSTGVTGTLPVANGGSGTATPSIVAGTNITVTGSWPNQTIAASGGGTPAGSTTQVQYNNAGAFAGSANFTFDGNNISVLSRTFGRGAATTGGANNVAGGQNALASNTTGEFSAAFGYNALTAQTTGDSNTAIGNAALQAVISGTKNTAVGRTSFANTTASDNTGLGYFAGLNTTTGGSNVSVGSGALQTNTTGGYNTALGWSALTAATTPDANTCIGGYAGYLLTTGGNNTFIGYLAGGWSGGGITTGTQNISIGYNTGGSSTAVNYSIVLGTSTTADKGSSTGFINPNSGGVYQGNNASTWSQTSDQRLKKNIVDNNIGLDKLTQIQVRNFEYRVAEEITELPKNQAILKTGVQLGVIAQELQAVLPECVKTESTGVMSVEADNLTWYMINAIKELKAENDSLKARLDAANL